MKYHLSKDLERPSIFFRALPSQDHHAGSPGFTIIEVVVIMAIIAILCSAAVYFSRGANSELKGAARELYADFQKAKLHAVNTKRNVVITFTQSNSNCSTASSYQFTDSGGNTVSSQTMQSGGVCISSVSGLTSGTSGFDTLGLAINPVGQIQLTHAESTKVYTISLSSAGCLSLQ